MGASQNEASQLDAETWRGRFSRVWSAAELAVSAFMSFLIFYATLAEMLATYRLPSFPVAALEPFRIANRYGLFAVMTRGRYEIEFQGSDDGQNWKPYHFRYKPGVERGAANLRSINRVSIGICGLRHWGRGASTRLCRTLSCGFFRVNKDVLQLFADNPFPECCRARSERFCGSTGLHL